MNAAKSRDMKHMKVAVDFQPLSLEVSPFQRGPQVSLSKRPVAIAMAVLR